jgi:hypothetical protein
MNAITTISLDTELKEEIEKFFNGRGTWNEILADMLEMSKRYKEMTGHRVEGTDKVLENNQEIIFKAAECARSCDALSDDTH